MLLAALLLALVGAAVAQTESAVEAPATEYDAHRLLHLIPADFPRVGTPTRFNVSIFDPWRSSDSKRVALKWSELVDPHGDGIGKLPLWIVSSDLSTIFHVTADLDFPQYNYAANPDTTEFQIALTLPRAGNYAAWARFEVLRTNEPKQPAVSYPFRQDTSRHVAFAKFVVAGGEGQPSMEAIADPSPPTTGPIHGIELNPVHPDTVTAGIMTADLALSDPISTPASLVSEDKFITTLSVSLKEPRLPVLPTNSCAFMYVSLSILEGGSSAQPLLSLSPLYQTYGLITVVHESLGFWDSKGTWIVSGGRPPGGLCPATLNSTNFTETPAPTTLSQTAQIDFGAALGAPLSFPLSGKYAVFVQFARTPFQEKRRTMGVARFILEVRDDAQPDPDVLAYLSFAAPGSSPGYSSPNSTGKSYNPANPQPGYASGSSCSTSGLVGGLVFVLLVALAALGALGFVLHREREGRPLLVAPEPTEQRKDLMDLEVIVRTVRTADDARPFVKMLDLE